MHKKFRHMTLCLYFVHPNQCGIDHQSPPSPHQITINRVGFPSVDTRIMEIRNEFQRQEEKLH